MLFKAELTPIPDLYERENGYLSDFERGDVTFTSDIATVTSKGRTPDQSTMIFISCSNLMDDVSRLIRNKEQYREWIGIGCSFNLKMHQSKGSIQLSSFGVDLGILGACELMDGIYESSTFLIEIARKNLAPTSAALPDMERSFAEFKTLFEGMGGTIPK